MFIVPIFQLRHNQRAKVRDKSEEAMQNCAGRGAFIIITIFNKVTSISNMFSKRLNSSLLQSIITDLQVCEDVPTKACNTVNEQVLRTQIVVSAQIPTYLIGNFSFNPQIDMIAVSQNWHTRPKLCIEFYRFARLSTKMSVK